MDDREEVVETVAVVEVWVETVAEVEFWVAQVA